MRKFSSSTPDNCKTAICGIIEEINDLAPLSLSGITPEKTVLVIVDVVNGFIREGAMASPLVESIIPPIAALLEKCRKLGIPAAAFADCHKSDCAEFASFPPHCVENTSESELVDELKAVGGYTLIKKNSTNGFHEENFRKFLDSHSGADTFIITGDCTDICVLQFCLALKTWFTKQNRQVKLIVPVNCVETYDAPFHDADLMNIAAYKLMKDCGITFVSAVKD